MEPLLRRICVQNQPTIYGYAHRSTDVAGVNKRKSQPEKAVCMVEPVNKKPFNYISPASHTEEGKRRVQAYYESLGRFVDMFAGVETAITLTLRKYAKTAPEIAKIVFSRTSLAQSCALIKELAQATGSAPELREDLTSVLKQLGIITEVRNSVLHNGAKSVAEGQGLVSNALRAKKVPMEFPISPEALDKMTSDLRLIAVHLNYRHLGRAKPRSEYAADVLDEALQSPWNYEHVSKPTKATEQYLHNGAHPAEAPSGEGWIAKCGFWTRLFGAHSCGDVVSSWGQLRPEVKIE